jgi:hypothetical protein
MASPTPGTFSFNKIGDMIHSARMAADKYTPGLDTLANVRAWPWMAPMYGAAQGDILNNHPVAGTTPPAAPTPTQAPQQAPFGQGSGPIPFMNNPFSGMSSQQPAPRPAPAAAPSPAPQVATPPQPASSPMPQARPAGAPQAPPDMSFFQRNTAMMRDPVTGAFIDPTAAAQAQQVTGPNLIDKMMTYLHNKDLG